MSPSRRDPIDMPLPNCSPFAGRRLPMIVIITLGASVIVLVAFSLVLGYIFVRPSRHPVGAPPTDLGAQTVHIASTSGSTLAGWYAPGVTGNGAILLLHGVRGNRWQMLDRARFLHRAGYTVLLIDFQAHGSSSGDRITYGFRESADARSALSWLATHTPNEPLAIIGNSMGAASALIALPLPVQALVLEESYTTIERVTTDRMHRYFGPLGSIIAPLLLAQLPARLGIATDSLRPIDHIANVHAPIYVMCGAVDHDVTLAESQKLFARANSPKQFWAVPNAGHTDLYAVAPAEYEHRVLTFLSQYLHH